MTQLNLSNVPRPTAGGNGSHPNGDASAARLRQVNLLLTAHGLPTAGDGRDHSPGGELRGLLESYHEKTRLLSDHRCPVDRRVEAFLQAHFAPLNLPSPLRLPYDTLVLDRPGLARDLSLPARRDEFTNSLLSSYRVANGVLHNPKSDRRTTAGHVPRRRGRAARPQRQAGGAAGGVRRIVPPGDEPAGGADDAPVHRRRVQARADVRLAAAPADRLPRGAGRLPAQDDGGAVLRARQPGEQPGFRRVDLRQRGRPVPPAERRGARRRALDGPHRLRRSSRRTWSG